MPNTSTKPYGEEYLLFRSTPCTGHFVSWRGTSSFAGSRWFPARRDSTRTRSDIITSFVMNAGLFRTSAARNWTLFLFPNGPARLGGSRTCGSKPTASADAAAGPAGNDDGGAEVVSFFVNTQE